MTNSAIGESPPDTSQAAALSFAFLWDYAEFVRRWASWAQEQAGHWPGGQPPAEVFRRALAGGPVLPPG